MDLRPKYEAQAREKIRRNLLAYKLKYKIGAPRLAMLIEDAHPRTIDVNQRRVSRFLARQNDPDEAFLDWCCLFLETVEQLDDPVETLGAALRAFCPEPFEPMDFEGLYRLRSGDAGDDVLNAHLVIGIEKDNGFWRIVQRDERQNEIYEGALVGSLHAAIAVLNNRRTGSSLMYMLGPHESGFHGNHLKMGSGRVLRDQPLRLERRNV